MLKPALAAAVRRAWVLWRFMAGSRLLVGDVCAGHGRLSSGKLRTAIPARRHGVAGSSPWGKPGADAQVGWRAGEARP